MRRNTAQQTYTLSPAFSSLSRRLRFFLPQVADGPVDSGTLQTGLLLTNISTKPAAVTLSLTGDDGSPLAVNIPGIDANGVVAGVIAPGATLFWQSDGASTTLTTGAAAIRSTQPLAIAASIRTVDGMSAILSETTLAPAPADFQLILPFDNASSTVVGATFWNTSTQPVALTLKLTDANGQALTTVQPSSLAGRARLTGLISDLFPGVSASSGAIVVSTPDLVDGSICSLALRNTPAGIALSSAPAARLPWTPTGTPLTVTPTLDTTRQASASIPPSGGSLSVSDAKGNRFTLTIPSGALLNRETITMTAILVRGRPFGAGTGGRGSTRARRIGALPAGALENRAGQPCSRGDVTGRVARPGPRSLLEHPAPRSQLADIDAHAFQRSYGAGGFDVTSELINIANLQDYYQSIAAVLIARGRQQQLSGMPDDETAQEIISGFEQYYDNVIVPMMELAQAGDDENVMRCALTMVLGFDRQLQLTGLADDTEGPGGAMDATIVDFLQYTTQRFLQKISGRCSNHDVTAYFDLLGAERQAALMGIATSLPDPSS